MRVTCMCVCCAICCLCARILYSDSLIDLVGTSLCLCNTRLHRMSVSFSRILDRIQKYQYSLRNTREKRIPTVTLRISVYDHRHLSRPICVNTPKTDKIKSVFIMKNQTAKIAQRHTTSGKWMFVPSELRRASLSLFK